MVSYCYWCMSGVPHPAWSSGANNCFKGHLLLNSVLFTLKKLAILPHLIFDNIAISFVDSHKHLDVTLSSNGQWHTHIENIVKFSN